MEAGKQWYFEDDEKKGEIEMWNPHASPVHNLWFTVYQKLQLFQDFEQFEQSCHFDSQDTYFVNLPTQNSNTVPLPMDWQDDN